MQSSSYVQGQWVTGEGGKTVLNAVTGEPVARWILIGAAV